MSTRTIAALMAACLMVAGGCGSEDSGGGDGGGGGEKKEVKAIAFFGFAAANSFAQATYKGVQREAKKEGVSAKFFDPKFDSQTQVSQIQNAITTGKYQAFIIQANDGNAVVPPVREAIDAGITVVGEFTPIGTKYDTIDPQVPGLIFVGEPPVENGKTLGKMGVEACQDKDPCNVAYLEGFKSLPLDNARTDAVKEVLKGDPKIKVVASVEGGYTQDSGLKAAQNVLQAHPDVDVMIGSSQAIAGAKQAVKDADAKVALIGNGGSRQAIKAVKSGDWFASYVGAESSNGAKAAELAIKAARGEKVPKSFDTRKLRDPYGTKEKLGSFAGEYDE